MDEKIVMQMIDGLLVSAGELVQAQRIEQAYASRIARINGRNQVVAEVPHGKMVHLSGPITQPARLRHAWDQTGLQLQLSIMDNGHTLYICPAPGYQMPYTAPRPAQSVREWR